MPLENLHLLEPDLKASFEDKKVEIYELKHYFNKIVPTNRFVEIEFSGDKQLFRFGIKALDSTVGDIMPCLIFKNMQAIVEMAFLKQIAPGTRLKTMLSKG